jgi:hypothetical protein
VRITEVEDVLMNDLDAEGEASDSSSNLDPVENIVVIPVPGPSVVHTVRTTQQMQVVLALRALS